MENPISAAHISAMQSELFPAPIAQAPHGFQYVPDLITPSQEAALTEWIAGVTLQPFEFRGYLGARRVASFGYRYDYVRRAVEAAEPLPGELLRLRQAVAEMSGQAPEAFVQTLITEYAPGAPIGWHRDKKEFGDVAGVSLLSPATLRFRRAARAGWERLSRLLQPRSVYLLRGEARSLWEHSIPPQKALRYSITFRTLAPG